MSHNESIVEDAALESFAELGYSVGHGLHIEPGEPAGRESIGAVVLVVRSRETIRWLNRFIPPPTLAVRRNSMPPKLLNGKLSLLAAETRFEVAT